MNESVESVIQNILGESTKYITPRITIQKKIGSDWFLLVGGKLKEDSKYSGIDCVKLGEIDSSNFDTVVQYIEDYILLCNRNISISIEDGYTVDEINALLNLYGRCTV